MTLEQLRIFVAVAEREHVTRAAEALNLTQSAVSSAIHALEGRHGVALFDRVGRGVVLNQTGEIFLEEARAVLARAAAAQSALDDLAGLRRGRLAIQASQTLASYWLPARLATFRAAYPFVTLDVAIGNTAQTVAAVVRGEAELGLIEGTMDEPALAARIIDHDQMILVVAPSHAWAGAQHEPSSLSASPWIMREAGSGTRSALESALTARGLQLEALDVVMILPSNEAVRAAAELGLGAAVVSQSVAAASLASGTLIQAPLDLAPRPYRLIRHKQRYQSRAALAFEQISVGAC